jgi:hypothetical protein
MSKKDNSLYVQLGDIIQINAPDDSSIHDKIFLVTYLNNTNVKLVSDDGGFEYVIRLNDDGTIGNESIRGISILSRDENIGYARQNNLLPGTWIDIFFSGDLPVTITGIITNIEEDMIEIKTYPDNDVIFLDFAYKGLPEDIPLEKIIIRTPPETIEEEKEEEKQQEFEVESLPSTVSEEDVSPLPPGEMVLRVTPTEMKTQIKELLIDADKIFIGEELDEIVQVVDVPEYEQRYNIDKQANDLLDELLSSIPNAQRNVMVLNNIHKMIERFKQLRAEFSKFDKHGNADMPDLQGANFKPLVNSLSELNKKLYWLLPVSKLKKKIYDLDEEEVDPEVYKDVVPLTLADERIKEEDIIRMYKTNSIPDEENKYNYLIKEQNELFTPYTDPDREEYRIAVKNVQDNINSVIDNLDDLKSSVIVKGNITRRKFVIQNYNLGISKLEKIETQGKKSYLKRVKLTSSDKITIKSFISLPESAVKYSHINLPKTNILEKSSLNMNNIQYWKFLNKKTPVTQYVVDDLNVELQFDEKTYLSGIKEYLLNESIEDNDKYNKYLNAIIPKTRVLFELVKKQINGKLSLYSIVKFLEPFLIYQKDLSFKQYETISAFIDQRILEFKKRYINKTKEFKILKKPSEDYFSEKPEMLKIKFQDYADDIKYNRELYEYYMISNSMTPGELLNTMNDLDYCKYYSRLLSMASQSLYIPPHLKDFDNAKDIFSSRLDKAIDKNQCRRFVISKSYSSIEELENDNDKELYFDSKYDNTHYDLLKKYKDKRDTLDQPAFIKFLADKLQELYSSNTSLEESEEEAVAIVEGKRLVKDGDYAVLFSNDTEYEYKGLDNPLITIYFKRVNNKWEQDNSLESDTFVADNKNFCNIQSNCYETQGVCKDEQFAEMSLKEGLIKDKSKEIGNTKFISPQARFDVLDDDIYFLGRRKDLLTDYKNQLLNKYNNLKIKIGDTSEDYDVVVSPYSKLRNLILGQPDFVKKQNDIIRFVNKYAREPTEDEDQYWKYCIDTKTKLIPSFFMKLAEAFISGQNYNDEYEKICASQGTISDDGNAWVDKHSGYVIGRIDFDAEEGYDEQGFKINTRDLLQEDISQKILGQQVGDKQYENPLARQIDNILFAMTSFMGIDLTNQKDFIIKNTLASQLNEEIVPSKAKYEKDAQLALSKGKKLPSYESIYDSSIIYLTLAYMLIGILTAIPSIKSKKTFPNCIKSFTGYPLTGVEDKTAMTYIACIAHKIKSSIKPWNSISKVSQQNIFNKLDLILDRYVVTNQEVRQKLSEKLEHLSQQDREELIPVEHDIVTWSNFLPPLREIRMQTPENVSSEFKAVFVDHLKRGNKRQHEQIDVIKSKIIKFSLGIQKSIQNVVSKEAPILKTASMEPYLENACCNQEGTDTFTYFTSREPDIIRYNNGTVELKNILDDIRVMTEACILYEPYDTRNIIPQLPKDFTEDTIYRAFVTYCRFNSILPVSENIRSICLSKPEDINVDDSISEIVRKLKRDSRNYSIESLDMLMKIVNSKNIINLHTKNNEFSPIHYLRAISENRENDFQRLLYEMLDTYDVALVEDNKEIRNFKNFLGRENTSMLERIKSFVKSHSKLNKTDYSNFVDTITNITEFNKIENDIFNDPENTTTYSYITFVKNVLRNIINVYPDIILNKVDYDEINIPKQWTTSYRHTEDIRSFVKKYYSPLRPFYNNKTIEMILKNIRNKTLYIYKLSEHTPFFSSIMRENKEIYSIFDKRMASLIFNYYILKVLITYIDLINYKDAGLISGTSVEESPLPEDPSMRGKRGKDYEEIMTEVELEEDAYGEISEFEILRGEKKQISSNISELIIAFIDIIRDEKKTINYNYEKIVEQVFRAKEKEKDDITSDLKRLTDDDREIENFFKNAKLEKWGVGLQKGFTRYAETTYDQERAKMEERLLLDITLKKNLQVHEMNADIYANDLLEEMRAQENADKEAFDISDRPDDDDYGDREDREDVDGYSYMMDDARYGYED